MIIKPTVSDRFYLPKQEMYSAKHVYILMQAKSILKKNALKNPEQTLFNSQVALHHRLNR